MQNNAYDNHLPVKNIFNIFKSIIRNIHKKLFIKEIIYIKRGQNIFKTNGEKRYTK